MMMMMMIKHQAVNTLTRKAQNDNLEFSLNHSKF